MNSRREVLSTNEKHLKRADYKEERNVLLFECFLTKEQKVFFCDFQVMLLFDSYSRIFDKCYLFDLLHVTKIIIVIRDFCIKLP